MKKILLFVLMLTALSLQSRAQKTGDTIVTNNRDSLKLQVYYFHITHRCGTCYAIEENLRKTLFTYFEPQINHGVIDLLIMNCELPENKDLVQKYDAYGATLAFSPYIKGIEQKPVDLTGWAFSKIHTPELFIEGLREKIVENLK